MNSFWILSVTLILNIDSAQSQSCSGTLTDQIRQKIVTEHNKLRSTLALGKAVTKGGGYAPTGSNIHKLTYNCTLEKQTQDWVDKCTFSHSDNSRGASENLYIAWGGDLSAATHIPRAIQSWWSELAKYGIADPQNRLTMQVFKSGIGHFSAMAWATSTQVGCAYSNKCAYNGNKAAYVICRYYEMGNYLNREIYKLGKPCSACPSNSKCSANEGLCTV